MKTIGRSMRGYKSYEEEIKFCKENGFECLQIEFQKGELLADQLEVLSVEALKHTGFPIMVHAVLELDDFDIYGDELVEIVGILGSREVIVRPLCEAGEIDERVCIELSDKVGVLVSKLSAYDVTLYIENNGSDMPLAYTAKDLKMLFENNPDVAFLLDLAHVDNYTHLGELVRVKYPRCLHISDKRFGMPHEHLPLGEGDLDYKHIFKKYLRDFEGKVILKVVAEDQVICDDKEMIEMCFDAKQLHDLKVLSGIEVVGIMLYSLYLICIRELTTVDMGILAAGFTLLSWTCAYRYWRERDKGNGWIYGVTGCIWFILVVYAAWAHL